MAILQSGSAEAEQINGVLSTWRQGDVALDVQWFIHAAQPNSPLTSAAADLDGTGPISITSEVAGIVVVSQTCDIVRNCTERPYLEVAPLVQISPELFMDVQRGRRPNYAQIPGVAERHLVADLDRVMTVEKSLVVAWTRTPGWTSDTQSREIAQALARKRARFAFPDDFTNAASRLRARLQEKHNKRTDEGRALQALREIRVRAAPSWDSMCVSLTFWFILDDQPDPAVGDWEQLCAAWLKLFPQNGRFTPIEGFVVELDDMTARDYVDSDRLDLDHLSSSENHK